MISNILVGLALCSVSCFIGFGIGAVTITKAMILANEQFKKDTGEDFVYWIKTTPVKPQDSINYAAE